MATFQRGGVRDESCNGGITARWSKQANSFARKDPGELADDMWLGHGSPKTEEVSFANGTAGGGDAASAGSQTVMDPTSVMELLSSEEQFFDCLRMRTIRTALGRAEGLARRLWKSRHYRNVNLIRYR